MCSDCILYLIIALTLQSCYFPARACASSKWGPRPIHLSVPTAGHRACACVWRGRGGAGDTGSAGGLTRQPQVSQSLSTYRCPLFNPHSTPLGWLLWSSALWLVRKRSPKSLSNLLKVSWLVLFRAGIWTQASGSTVHRLRSAQLCLMNEQRIKRWDRSQTRRGVGGGFHWPLASGRGHTLITSSDLSSFHWIAERVSEHVPCLHPRFPSNHTTSALSKAGVSFISELPKVPWKLLMALRMQGWVGEQPPACFPDPGRPLLPGALEAAPWAPGSVWRRRAGWRASSHAVPLPSPQGPFRNPPLPLEPGSRPWRPPWCILNLGEVLLVPRALCCVSVRCKPWFPSRPAVPRGTHRGPSAPVCWTKEWVISEWKYEAVIWSGNCSLRKF